MGGEFWLPEKSFTSGQELGHIPRSQSVDIACVGIRALSVRGGGFVHLYRAELIFKLQTHFLVK